MNSTPELPSNIPPEYQNQIQYTIAQLKELLQTKTPLNLKEAAQRLDLVLDLMSDLIELGYPREDLRNLILELKTNGSF